MATTRKRVDDPMDDDASALVRKWLKGRDDVTVREGRSRRRVDFEVGELSGTLRLPILRDGSISVTAAELDETEPPAWLLRWVALYAETWSPAGIRLRESEPPTIEVSARLSEEAMSEAEVGDVLDAVLTCARRVRFVLQHPPEMDEWGHWVGGFEDMVITLADADLPIPPVPEPLRPIVVRLSPWFWATADIDPISMYLGGPPNAAPGGDATELQEEGDDTFAMAHVGHGFNSYFLAYLLRYRGRRIWERHSWGGAYSDPAWDRDRFAEAMERLRARVTVLERGSTESDETLEGMSLGQLRVVAKDRGVATRGLTKAQIIATLQGGG